MTITLSDSMSDFRKNANFFLKIVLSLELVFVVFAAVYFYEYGHLPTPFFYDSSDTFMDFYNTNFWSLHDGRFDLWKSIYPIFVFLVAQISVSSSCAASLTPFVFRNCDPFSLIYLIVPYLLGCFICAQLLASHEHETANHNKWLKMLLWFLLIAFSLQGLFALERGNYIVYAFLFLALSVKYEHDWRGALFLALAINFKQYLLILWVIPLIKRRFDLFVLSCLFVVVLNIIGLLFVPETHYGMLLDNMLNFSSTLQISFFEKMWNPTSISAWLRVFENSTLLEHAMRYDVVLWLTSALGFIVAVSRMLIVTCLLLLFLRAGELDKKSIGFVVLLCFVVLSDSPGGYSLLLLFPFLSGVLSRPMSKFTLLLLVFAFIPIELPIGPGIVENEISFLSGLSFSDISRISSGALFRPAILLGLLVMITLDLAGMKVRNQNKPNNNALAMSNANNKLD